MTGCLLFVVVFMFPYITVFSKEIGMYGLVSVLGLFIACFVGYRLAKKKKIEVDDFILAVLVAIVSGFIFAHLLFGLTNISAIIELSQKIMQLGFFEYIKGFLICFSGMVFFGGLFGAILGIIIFTKYYKPLFGKREIILDIFAVVFPLFHVFGRIGCFLGGCCYGVESEFGFIVYDNTINPSINGVRRFPVQLTESFFCLILFFVLLYLYKKGKFKNNLLFVYLISYCVIRFIDEFFRGDEIRGIYFSLSTSQWISLLIIVISVIILMYKKSRDKKRKTGRESE